MLDKADGASVTTMLPQVFTVPVCVSGDILRRMRRQCDCTRYMYCAEQRAGMQELPCGLSVDGDLSPGDGDVQVASRGTEGVISCVPRHLLHVHPLRPELSTARLRKCTRVGTLIVATIYLRLIQNRYMIRSFTLLQCSHQHCVQPVASDVEVVGYL